MGWREERAAASKVRAELLERLQLRIETRFVPYSQSRNYEKKWQSLNWKVDVFVGKRKIFEGTDYTQGIGHTPAYKKKFSHTYLRDNAAYQEIESGCHAKPGWSDGSFYPDRKRKIEPPSLEEVMASLVMDGFDAMNHPNVESWAPDYGYDPDSRTAEKIYKECLQIGLTLRSALGDEAFRELREAYYDY